MARDLFARYTASHPMYIVSHLFAVLEMKVSFIEDDYKWPTLANEAQVQITGSKLVHHIIGT